MVNEAKFSGIPARIFQKIPGNSQTKIPGGLGTRGVLDLYCCVYVLVEMQCTNSSKTTTVYLKTSWQMA